MTTPAQALTALQQRAQVQTQANRYIFLRNQADNKLVQKIVKS